MIAAAVLCSAAFALTGCGNGENKGGAGDTSFAGTYHMTSTPLFLTMDATDPNAVAITIPSTGEGVEPTSMTYASINQMLSGLVLTADMGGEGDFTFGVDGSVSVTFTEAQTGTTVVFPSDAMGIPASAFTYSISGDNIVFKMGSEMMDMILDVQNSPDVAAVVKPMLAKLSGGILAYSQTDNSATVTLKYERTADGLELYADKAAIAATWTGAQGVLADISALVGQSSPEVATLLAAILPQINTVLDGYQALEIGFRLTQN